MARLFRVQNNGQMTEREMLESRYNSARMNLLLVVAFSAINLITLATNSGMYFLFSASIPYLLTDLGMFFCGMYPDEIYTGELAGMVFAPKSLFVVLLIVSFLILGVYLLCWFCSKDHKANWLIAALVLFSFDTVILFLNYGFSALVDLGFHIWVIVILAMGISAHFKLMKAPADLKPIESDFTELPTEEQNEPAIEEQNEPAVEEQTENSVAEEAVEK